MVAVPATAWHNRPPRDQKGAEAMSVAFAASTGDLGAVEDKKFVIRDFLLQNGAVMPEAAIAYETYGRLGSTAATRC